jgi:hypothetical protein
MFRCAIWQPFGIHSNLFLKIDEQINYSFEKEGVSDGKRYIRQLTASSTALHSWFDTDEWFAYKFPWCKNYTFIDLTKQMNT